MNFSFRYVASTEFLLVENRQPMGVDSAALGSGMVVYHIDDAISGGANSARKNSRPLWTTTRNDPTKHYFHRIEQGDGQDDLECGEGSDTSDVFLTSGKLESIDTSTSAVYSSTYSYSGHNQATGNRLEVLSYSSSDRRLDLSFTTDVNSASPTSFSGFMYSTTCAAGHFSLRNGTCEMCPVGKYNPSAGGVCLSACQICPDGKYSDTAGSTECTPCPPGTFDDVSIYPSNSSSCVDCSLLLTAGYVAPGTFCGLKFA